MNINVNRPEPAVYEFDRFRVDSGRRRLTGRDGETVPLTPRLFDTLLFMVEHPNVVLTKDELMRAIWPDTEVAENNLNQAVSSLRRALGESQGDPHFIVTVPGHGYRFAATVREAAPIASEAAPALPSPRPGGNATRDDSSGRHRRSSPAAALVAALIAGSIGAAYWLGRSTAATPESAATAGLRGRLVAVTWEEGAEVMPSISPDGNSFVYVSRASGNADIYLRRIGGETSMNLTKESAADDYAPAYSPDGRTIAFRSERDGGGVFLMGATGESVRRLTDFGHDPAWSPDGRTLAVAAESSSAGSITGTGGLWLVEVSTGAPRKLWEGYATHPSWSPSGTRIAFDGRTPDGLAFVSTIAVRGGEPVRCAPTSTSGSAHATWTADGILYTTRSGSSSNAFRVRVDEATGAPIGEPEQITMSASDLRNASSSADGTRILFQGGKPKRTITRTSFDSKRGVLGSEFQSVLATSRDLSSERPSPDNQWLAARLDENGQFDIITIRTETGEARRLTDDPSREEFFAWTADSSRFLFMAAPPNGNSEIWSIGIDGGGRERVLSVANENLVDPALSSDGRTLYVLVGADYRPHMVDLTGPANQRKATALPSIDADRALHLMRISPDGRWLLGLPYSGSGKSIGNVLFLYDVAGKTYRELKTLDGRVFDWRAWWLPDSQRILLYSNVDERFEILDRETGVSTPGGPGERGVRYSELSHDGHWMFETRFEVEMDIWMLDYRGKRHPDQ
jgi:eukaryotic-like serine/threonine-protein kinase